MITITYTQIEYILGFVYLAGVAASLVKISKQVDKHPELDNPVYAIGGFLGSFGSWFTYLWMKNEDKINGGENINK